ncbi:MAG: BACON domain-containing protein, partial [Blastocatellia bacterium]
MAGAGCGWTASPDPAVASWINITSPSGGTGSGNGTVSFTVAANTTQSARNGVIHVADQMFLVSESGPCSYTLDFQSSTPFAASGGQGVVNVTTGDTCTVTVTTNVFWVDNLSESGTQCSLGVCGSGTLFYHVEANPTTQPRSAIIMIGDQTFTVTQDAGCALAFTPATGLLNFPSAGSTQTVTVAESGAANCTWTATAVDSFITVNPPGTGSGANGNLSLTLGMNPLTTSRSGIVDITSSSGFTYQYRVTQDGSICGYTVTTTPPTNPLTINALQGGGTFTNGVNVVTGSNCSWTAQSNVTWILVWGGNGGPVSFTGSSGLSFIVSANTGSTQRTGTMSIAGTTVNVIQPGSCSYSLSSSGQSF